MSMLSPSRQMAIKLKAIRPCPKVAYIDGLKNCSHQGMVLGACQTRRFSKLSPLQCSSSPSKNESSEDLIVEHLKDNREGIVVFGLNRPKAKNAFSRNMVKCLIDSLEKVRFEKNCRVVIFKSTTPGIFSAGADLKERATMQEHEVGPLVAKARMIMSMVENLPMPTIAAIDGHALGGGMELSLACDIRIAAENAKMGLVETKLAIIPGAGGTQRLPRIIGPSKAKELMFTARIINGREAGEFGLANYSVAQNDSGDSAYQKALELAEEIIPNGPIGVKMAKVAINKGSEVDMQSGMAIEEGCYAQVIPTKDRMEGLMAFIEKRKPNYTGE